MEFIKTKLQGEIYEIALNRPEKRNALNIPLLEELCAAIESASNHRVLILRGEGPTFCAGLDLEEASQEEHTEKSAHLIAKTLRLLYHSPLLTIAALHGAAVAGGAGLAAACDIAIATQECRIGFPEVKRGLVAAQVSTLLSRQLRQRDLRSLLLLGDLVDAFEAKALGLIQYVVDSEHLLKETYQIAQKALQGGPKAIAETKRLINELSPGSFDEDLQHALLLHHTVRNSDEAREGMQAFLEKRNPEWIVHETYPDRV